MVDPYHLRAHVGVVASRLGMGAGEAPRAAGEHGHRLRRRRFAKQGFRVGMARQAFQALRGGVLDLFPRLKITWIP